MTAEPEPRIVHLGDEGKEYYQVDFCVYEMSKDVH